jgi:hypothetical protein
MRFTDIQYQTAIADLEAARKQLVPDGNVCSVCEDGGHMAFECGFNPLVAMRLCRTTAKAADELHDSVHAEESDVSEKTHQLLHWLAGYDSMFGVHQGPAKVVVPHPDNRTARCRGGEHMSLQSNVSDKRDWLVLSLKWSTNEFLVWYCTGRAGYTTSLMKAGRFSETEARREVVEGVTLAVNLNNLLGATGVHAAMANDQRLIRKLKRLSKPKAVNV